MYLGMRSRVIFMSHFGRITMVLGVNKERKQYACKPYVWCSGRNASVTGIPSLVFGVGGFGSDNYKNKISTEKRKRS